MSEGGGFVVAGLIGLIVAFVELLARYRDDPWRAVLSAPAAAYGLINGGAAVLAAWWIASFFPGAVSTLEVAQVAALRAKGAAVPIDALKLALVAGLGSLALLRTSLLKLKINNGDEVAVGPAVIIDQLLAVVDRSVDRHLAVHRAQIAAEVAAKVDFATHSTSLVALCLTLLQNPTSAEQQQITAASQALAGRTDIPATVKSVSLVLALLGLVGETVLREAVKQLPPKP